MAKPWYIQMTAYAIMVEELTGHAVDNITAIVGVEGMNTFQIFEAQPQDYVDELYQLQRTIQEPLRRMINIHYNDMHMVSVIPDFMTQHECDHILQHSLQTMQPSKVVSDDGEGQKHKGRTGSNTWLPHNTNDVILNVAQRLSDTVRMPLENAEPFQVVHYEVGQEYDYHWDSFDKSDESYNEKYVSQQGGTKNNHCIGLS